MTITFRKAFQAEKHSSTDIAVSRFENENQNPTIILTIGADYGAVSSQIHLTAEDAKNLLSILSESLEVAQ